MALPYVRYSNVWKTLGFVEEEEPPPDIPPGQQSYWTMAAPIIGGWELDPNLPKKAGIPPGVTLTPGPSGTLQGSTLLWVERSFTGNVSVNTDNVVFLRCKFTSAGYTPHVNPGSSLNLVTGSGRPTFIDCEFYGAASTALNASSSFFRCYFTEGNDILRLKAPTTTITECVMDGCLRASSDSHSDAIQGTTNSPSTSRFVLNVNRSWLSAYNRFTLDPHNAVIQSGSWGSASGGMSGTLRDNYFNGGNYTFNGGGNAPDLKLTFTGNRYGRDYRFGVFAGDFAAQSVIDNTNVWADTLQPIFGS